MNPVDLPFQDHPDSAAERRLILAELARAQALFLAAVQPGARNRFTCWGQAYWVDQRRWLVLPELGAAPFLEQTAVPVSDATEDLLSFYAGESRSLCAIEAVDVFAWLVAGILERWGWMPTVTQAMNLFVVQPLVNPACAPLAWHALFWALVDADTSEDVMEQMRPLVFEMSNWPDSRISAPAVRRAQAEYFRRHEPALLPADWATLEDTAWAEACAQLVFKARYGMESDLFALIARRGALMRRGDWYR